MRKTLTRNLRIGDWIHEGRKDGKAVFGRVKNIPLEEFTEIDIVNGKIISEGNGVIEKDDGLISVLNKKEIKSFKILRTKLKTLKSLEDEPVTKRKF